MYTARLLAVLFAMEFIKHSIPVSRCSLVGSMIILFGQVGMHLQCSAEIAVADILLLVQHIHGQVFAVVLSHGRCDVERTTDSADAPSA